MMRSLVFSAACHVGKNMVSMLSQIEILM